MDSNISSADRDEIARLARPITNEFNITHLLKDNIAAVSDNISSTNYEVQWYHRLYSLRKLGVSNLFNLNPIIHIEVTDENKTIVKNCNVDTDFYNSKKTKNFYALLSATDQDMIFAALDISGNLMFLTDTLCTIKKATDVETVNALIRTACEFTANILNTYHNGNGTDLLKSDMIAYLLNDLCIKLGTGFLDFENNITRVGLIIDDTMKTLFRNERNEPVLFHHMVNMNEMYRTVLNHMMKNQKSIEEQAINKGIVIGSKFFTSFQRNGYIYNHNDGKWEKRVNMIPEFCIKNSKLYKIPEAHRKSYVETLTFDPASILSGDRFVLKARGSHPNVSSCGTVCIGSDLSNKFSLLMRNRQGMILEYVNFIAEVEEALKIINYDSAYNGMNFDSSVLIPVNTSDLPRAERPTSTLKRV